MKKIVILLFVLFPFLASAEVLETVYSSTTVACQQSAVASTGTNTITVTKNGYYEIKGYVSNTDFSGLAIKCLQGGTTVTVNSVNGFKIPAGDSEIRLFAGGSRSISCQTGSGSGYYDVCLMD